MNLPSAVWRDSSKMRALFSMLRPLNGIFGSLAVAIGFLNARQAVPPPVPNGLWFKLAAGMLTYFLVAGFANLLNDRFDVEIDRVNRPRRPLPSGIISPQAVCRTAGIVGSLALVMSMWVAAYSPHPVAIPSLTLLLLALGYGYARYGKRAGYAGNLLVGVAFAGGVPVGAMLHARWNSVPGRIWIFALAACLLLVGREIVKDMQDLEGDRIFGGRSLPIRCGNTVAAWTATVHVFCAGFCLVMVLPIVPSWPAGLLLVVALAGVIIALTALLRCKSDAQAARASGGLKLAAYCGLSAFLLFAVQRHPEYHADKSGIPPDAINR